jgi:hypothetical protein
MKEEEEMKNEELDFFESIEMLSAEAESKQSKAGSKQSKAGRNALYKWGADFDEEKFEPLPRIFLENLDVFQFRGSELAVLIQILMWWTNRDKWPTCFYDAIASRTGLSTRMIMDTLKKLEEKQVIVPTIEYEVVRNKPHIVYKEVKWKKRGLIKRLKYNELPSEMKTRSNNGARFFDLSSFLDICSHLIKQKNAARKGEEAISKIRQIKSSQELVHDITSSKDFKEYIRFLRKHQ